MVEFLMKSKLSFRNTKRKSKGLRYPKQAIWFGGHFNLQCFKQFTLFGYFPLL